VASRAWKRLDANLAELARVPSRIVKPISATITRLLKEQFKQGMDSYGTPWVPLRPTTIARKGGDTRIMIHTGAMRAQTIAITLAGSGIALVSVPYAAYHQEATPNRAARPVLPNRASLPITWSTAIQTEWRRAFQSTMSR
jgi:hypothetical protein